MKNNRKRGKEAKVVESAGKILQQLKKEGDCAPSASLAGIFYAAGLIQLSLKDLTKRTPDLTKLIEDGLKSGNRETVLKHTGEIRTSILKESACLETVSVEDIVAARKAKKRLCSRSPT